MCAEWPIPTHSLGRPSRDRKSTRLNSSHLVISYAVFCLKKKPIMTRPATLDDLPFIDRLQKMHTKMVGWMPTKQLEGKIKAGHVLVAEEASGRQCVAAIS